jgi:16S rRNA (adenine1518-N6/adenine1519-N6)-dimethyltransferase
LKKVVQAAFTHRRKRLANSLELSGFGRGRVDEALARLGLPGEARAEELRPEQFEELAERLA